LVTIFQITKAKAKKQGYDWNLLTYSSDSKSCRPAWNKNHINYQFHWWIHRQILVMH
jgi:hypothetical protein